jgi:hypothetical protein
VLPTQRDQIAFVVSEDRFRVFHQIKRLVLMPPLADGHEPRRVTADAPEDGGGIGCGGSVLMHDDPHCFIVLKAQIVDTPRSAGDFLLPLTEYRHGGR